MAPKERLIRHMQATPALLVTAVTLGLTASAAAQAPAESPATPTASVLAFAPVDVGRLPVSLSRIQRRLQASAEREAHDGLNLKFFVDVYGQAPPIELFTKQDNLSSGPVPYGAPTHGQILEVITPREHRAPMADFSALMRWLSDRSKK